MWVHLSYVYIFTYLDRERERMRDIDSIQESSCKSNPNALMDLPKKIWQFNLDHFWGCSPEIEWSRETNWLRRCGLPWGVMRVASLPLCTLFDGGNFKPDQMPDPPSSLHGRNGRVIATPVLPSWSLKSGAKNDWKMSRPGGGLCLRPLPTIPGNSDSFERLSSWNVATVFKLRFISISHGMISIYIYINIYNVTVHIMYYNIRNIGFTGSHSGDHRCASPHGNHLCLWDYCFDTKVANRNSIIWYHMSYL